MDFSSETLQTRKEWDDTFKELKEKIMSAKLYFKNEGEIDLPRQTKTEGFLYHQMCLTRYAKGSSLI